MVTSVLLEPSANTALIRKSKRSTSYSVALVRSVAYIPYFKFASALLLPHSLSFPALVAIGLSYAVFCHEISCRLETQPFGRRDVVPLQAGWRLFALLALALPPITYLLSPNSYGQHLDTPYLLSLSFAALALPCCACFVMAQRQARRHDRILFRLGLVSLEAARHDMPGRAQYFEPTSVRFFAH